MCGDRSGVSKVAFFFKGVAVLLILFLRTLFLRVDDELKGTGQ
jgi:hypothetical protein